MYSDHTAKTLPGTGKVIVVKHNDYISVKGANTQRFDSLHALLEHRVASGLADDDICPLHHHNAYEKGCVASELHDLALLVCLYRGRQNDSVTIKSMLLYE